MAVVDAIFTIDGNSYRGVNPCDRIDRIEGVNEGLSAPNAKMSTMHAEVEAMTNAQKAGVRGGDGMLEIQGKKMCPYCKGDVKKLGTQMELDSLTILDADGSIYVFNKDEMKPVKDGGLGYNDAKINGH